MKGFYFARRYEVFWIWLMLSYGMEAQREFIWLERFFFYFFSSSTVGKITLYMRIWAAYSINLILAYMIEEMRLLKKRVELLYMKKEDFVNSLKAKFKSNWLFIRILLKRLGNLIKYGNKVTQLLYRANWHTVVKILFSELRLIKICFILPTCVL